mmetsp:Transcript_3337/g.9626  ORF Transcript_3337/g.9626 Transcript_3337/m.9626 type:complete len:185 (-) Transcript_3337:202-756(-)
MPLSHPPLLSSWRYDVASKESAGGMQMRLRALQPLVRHAIDDVTEQDLRSGLGRSFETLARSTGIDGMQVRSTANLMAEEEARRPKTLVDTPGAVYRHVWKESAQPVGASVFQYTKRKGFPMRYVPPPRSNPQSLDAWFREYGKPDPNVRFGRPSEFTPGVRLHGSGKEAFRTNVKFMRKGDLG